MDKKERPSPRRERTQNVLEVLGVLLIVAGLGLWSVPVALIVAGVAVLLLAHPLPIPTRSDS